uniref:type II toxin-antitoxin system RelE/ParE family toxin n=1 Tax=uncultured Sphingomonas sp. TaxID=158754 RepID=UPI0035CAD2B8
MAVRWSIGSRRDLARIFTFNTAYSDDHAERIDACLVDAANLIARNPLIGRRIGASNVRERLLSDIQYIVRYRIDTTDDITILNVRHSRENRQERP